MKGAVLFLCLGVLASVCLAEDNVLLKPIRDTGDEAGLIFLQGAQIPVAQYQNIAEAIQKATTLKLWISIPSCFLDAVEPAVINGMIDSGLKDMAAAGYTPNKNLFFAGHSLGGAMLNEWTVSHADKMVGQILLGSGIERKYRTKEYPVSTLHIGGSLDGLYRVTRLAEEFYYRVQNGPDALRFPVAVIEGMSHMQFGSGTPPTLVRLRDLKPTITEAAAHGRVGEIMDSFFQLTLSDKAGAAYAAAAQKMGAELASTKEYMAPIIAAFELEGSRHFNSPEQKGGPSEDCPKGGCSGVGSMWAVEAQRLIADVTGAKKDGFEIRVTNQYVELSSTPITGEEFHLPNITADPQNPNILYLPTYSQGYWDKLDSLVDGGFASISASEIATKMLSRQCTKIRGEGVAEADAPFTLDDPDFCKQANELALARALSLAAPAAKARFAALGTRLTFSADVAKSGGPFWIAAGLGWDSKKTDAGEDVIDVYSPMVKTSFDYPKFPGLPDPACFHYCKLMSPARALEWVYVDGLRLRAGINPPAAAAGAVRDSIDEALDGLLHAN